MRAFFVTAASTIAILCVAGPLWASTPETTPLSADATFATLDPSRQALGNQQVAVVQATVALESANTEPRVKARIRELEAEVLQGRTAVDAARNQGAAALARAEAELQQARDAYVREVGQLFARLQIAQAELDRYKADLATVLVAATPTELEARQRFADGDFSQYDRLEEMVRTRQTAETVAQHQRQAAEWRQLATNYATMLARGEPGRTSRDLLRRWDTAAGLDPDNFGTQLERTRLATMLGLLRDAVVAGEAAMRIAQSDEEIGLAFRAALPAAMITRSSAEFLNKGFGALIERPLESILRRIQSSGQQPTAADVMELGGIMWGLMLNFGPMFETMPLYLGTSLNDDSIVEMAAQSMQEQSRSPEGIQLVLLSFNLRSLSDSTEEVNTGLEALEAFPGMLIATRAAGNLDDMDILLAVHRRRLDAMRTMRSGEITFQHEEARHNLRRGDLAEAKGDFAGAAKAFRLAASQYRALVARDPTVELRRQSLIYALLQEARMVAATGTPQAALGVLREAAVQAAAIAEANPHSFAGRRLGIAVRHELAAIPGSDIDWSQVVDDYEALRADGLLIPLDEQLLATARERAATEAVDSR